MEQPRGYEKKGSEHLVYKLNKALYGLKQAPRLGLVGLKHISSVKIFRGAIVSIHYSQRKSEKEKLSL